MFVKETVEQEKRSVENRWKDESRRYGLFWTDNERKGGRNGRSGRRRGERVVETRGPRFINVQRV